MFNYFDNIPLNNEEKITEERAEKIKASVLSRIKKEEKSMKKTTAIKTLSIAAVAAATAMMSAVIANAELSQAPAQEADVEEISGWVEVVEGEEIVPAATENATTEISDVSGWVKETDPEPDVDVDPESPDYITVFYDDEWDVYYYYDNNNTEVVPHEAIYKEVDDMRIVNHEVKELLLEDGKLVYVKLEV